jgi:hypothetical protein
MLNRTRSDPPGAGSRFPISPSPGPLRSPTGRGKKNHVETGPIPGGPFAGREKISYVRAPSGVSEGSGTRKGPSARRDASLRGKKNTREGLGDRATSGDWLSGDLAADAGRGGIAARFLPEGRGLNCPNVYGRCAGARLLQLRKGVER